MDMETVLPRTCQGCHGRGYIYFGNEDDWDIQPCDECDDESGANYLLAADAQDELELQLEDKENYA